MPVLTDTRPRLIAQQIVGVAFSQHHLPDDLLTAGKKGQLVEIKLFHQSKLLISGDGQMIIQPESIHCTADILIAIAHGVDPFFQGILADALSQLFKNYPVAVPIRLESLTQAQPGYYGTVILYHPCLYTDQRQENIEGRCREIGAVPETLQVIEGKMSLPVVKHAKCAGHARRIKILLQAIVFRYVVLCAGCQQESDSQDGEKSLQF